MSPLVAAVLVLIGESLATIFTDVLHFLKVLLVNVVGHVILLEEPLGTILADEGEVFGVFMHHMSLQAVQRQHCWAVRTLLFQVLEK